MTINSAMIVPPRSYIYLQYAYWLSLGWRIPRTKYASPAQIYPLSSLLSFQDHLIHPLFSVQIIQGAAAAEIPWTCLWTLSEGVSWQNARTKRWAFFLSQWSHCTARLFICNINVQFFKIVGWTLGVQHNLLNSVMFFQSNNCHQSFNWIYAAFRYIRHHDHK